MIRPVDGLAVTPALESYYIKNMKVGRLDLNMFVSNISSLQQGWRLVVSVYRQAQTELGL